MKKSRIAAFSIAALLAAQLCAAGVLAGCAGGKPEQLTFEIADITAWVDYPASEINPVFNLPGEHTVEYTTNSNKISISGNKITALAEGEAVVYASVDGYETDFNVVCKNVDTGDGRYYLYKEDDWHWMGKAVNARNEYDQKGTDGKTTIFIGDSFNDIDFFSAFPSFYRDKDALCLGIGGTTSNTWEMFLDSRFTDNGSYHYNGDSYDYKGVLDGIHPKNVVVQLGNNNIYNDHSTYDEAVEDLQRFFVLLHGKMPDSQIYYFGVTPRTAGEMVELNTALVKKVNKAMGKFCEGKNWIVYLDTNDTVTADDLRDDIHLRPEKYQIFVDALNAAGMVVENDY